MVVPQTSQTALVAFLPFFIVTSWASFPSLFVLHFTQYIDIYITPFMQRLRLRAQYSTEDIDA